MSGAKDSRGLCLKSLILYSHTFSAKSRFRAATVNTVQIFAAIFDLEILDSRSLFTASASVTVNLHLGCKMNAS